MNDEEILEKSQMENRGRDVADIEISKSGIRAGWIVTVFLTIFAGVVDYMAFGRLCYELLFAVMAGLSVVFVCKYLNLRKKHELAVAICYGVSSVAWLFAWVLQITNR